MEFIFKNIIPGNLKNKTDLNLNTEKSPSDIWAT